MTHSNNLNHILLMEEADNRAGDIIIDWLKDHSIVTLVSSEATFLEAIKSQRWNLIITNTTLSTLNDVDITKIAKAIDPITPVLIVTENQKINFILNALQNHADGLLFKPLDKVKFIDLASKLIQEAQDRRVRERNVVLAIGAHPDDVEIGCGGTLARHHAKNDIIHILTLSLGELGGDPLIRKEEATLAAKVQDATLHLADLPDAKITDGHETIYLIEKIIDEIHPTYIYTHSVHDNHKDHRNIYHATVPSCRHISNLFCYQSPSSTVEFKPNAFVEIFANDLEKKLLAIACFKSQCEQRPYLHEDMIRAAARYWGRFCNYGFAEAMEVVREKK